MATTPKHNIYYPTTSDLITPLANKFASLANSVDAAITAAVGSDTGWVDLTLESGYTAGTINPAYRVINGIVYWRGRLNKTVASAGSTPFSVPSPARPRDNTSSIMDIGSTTNFARMALTTGGGCTVVASVTTFSNLSLGGIPPYPSYV